MAKPMAKLTAKGICRVLGTLGAPRELSESVRTQLEGAFPEHELENLTCGCERSVFRMGQFIIKTQGSGNLGYRNVRKPPVATFAREGLSPPKQWFVGKWMVQPVYMPLTHEQMDRVSGLENHARYDLHPGNLGSDPQGRIVAFDW